MDTGTRTIRGPEGTAHVEPQVFDLLLYLIENRARVVDRDELIARVWKGRVVSDATIASRLNAARSAVGDDGRRQHVIATVPRKGLRFVAAVEERGRGVGRPAVAVLPFALLSSDPSDTYLARGLADQLAGTLGQASWFDVRDTAASFAGRIASAEPAEAARLLGASYIVTGSLLVAAGELRLTVRLGDPASGALLWSASFVAPRDGIFEMQDRIAARLLGEIEPRLRRTELQRSVESHGNLTAFDHYLRAADALRAMDRPGLTAACDELDRAIAEHPDYAAAHAMRAWIGTLLLPQGHHVDQAAERERCRLALAAGAFDVDALSMGGYALGFFERDPLTGLSYVRRALALNPSAARAHDFAGWLLLYAGKADEALAHFERGLDLCPIDEFAFRMLTGRAFAQLFLKRFETAVTDARRAHAAAPGYSVCHRVLAAALAHLGDDTGARSAVRELAAINPGLTVARYGRETRFESPGDREILLGGLKRAGLR